MFHHKDTEKISTDHETIPKTFPFDSRQISFDPCTRTGAKESLELIEYYCSYFSIIFFSQFMPENRHERLGDSVLANSVLFGSDHTL